MFYPTRLTHGPAKGTFQAADRLPMKGNPPIRLAEKELGHLEELSR